MIFGENNENPACLDIVFDQHDSRRSNYPFNGHTSLR